MVGNANANSGAIGSGNGNTGVVNNGNVNNGNIGSGNVNTGNVVAGNNVDVDVDGGWNGYPAGAYATGVARRRASAWRPTWSGRRRRRRSCCRPGT